MDYPWYKNVPPESPLEQGDIISGCSVIMPEAEHYNAILTGVLTQQDIPIEKFDAVVLSQSCDLAHGKIDAVIVCPVIELRQFLNDISVPSKEREKWIKELHHGKMPAYHLLNELGCKVLPQGFCIVNFHHIYSLPKMFLQEIVKTNERIRLLPPYREHLSQSFARYFMRVGLPSDIAEDKIKNYGKQM
jgi:hypothetical protein